MGSQPLVSYSNNFLTYQWTVLVDTNLQPKRHSEHAHQRLRYRNSTQCCIVLWCLEFRNHHLRNKKSSKSSSSAGCNTKFKYVRDVTRNLNMRSHVGQPRSSYGCPWPFEPLELKFADLDPNGNQKPDIQTTSPLLLRVR